MPPSTTVTRHYNQWISYIKSYSALCQKGRNMDAEVVKTFKHLQEQINELYSRQEQYLLNLHNDNSDAIDDLTITLLGEEATTNV